MAEEEKTELPSAKKIEKAREEGNVAKSLEVVGFLGLVAGFGGVVAFFSKWLEHFEGIFWQSLRWIALDVTPHKPHSHSFPVLKGLAFVHLLSLYFYPFVAVLAQYARYALY
ncbi:EscU/YscU/HrcU family type III secretion system export apparatus switch protein, partial [Helicobacter felis]|uniref:EscU/YscU/HrcU family type III secretion system export apparatus switch protein n=1 Tax=Helicobacter felis TaxID=214 RepID=UPI0018F7ECEA